jgi:hypothetical protein
VDACKYPVGDALLTMAASGQVQLHDALDLCLSVAPVPPPPPPNIHEYDQNLAAFRSSDGGSTFAFQQLVATHNETMPPGWKPPAWTCDSHGCSGWEGPGENDLVLLGDGSLLAVFRVDSCNVYWMARSTDKGASFSKATALPFGSARPKLLMMPSGQPLLAGGRPGLFLWLGDATGSHWSAIDLAFVHNELTRDTPAWQYSTGFVNGTTPCEPQNVSRGQAGFIPASSTSYTSLLQVAPDEFVVHYDRLANGWATPPGVWGRFDFTFSMRFSWSE